MSVLQHNQVRQTTRLQNIQALRAIAALLVIGQHASIIYGKVSPTHIWMNGGTGVDIFFAISGLVMVLSSTGLVDRVDGWKIFLIRRIERIVPLYWLYTTIKLIAMFALPFLAKNGPPTFFHTLCSYLFIPAFDEGGYSEPTPIVNPGWSLNFEMLFYCFFTLALFLRISAIKALTPIFLILTGLYFFNSPFSETMPVNQSLPAVFQFASPITLEFLFGIFIGTALLQGRKLPERIAIPLAIIAFVILMISPYGLTLTDLHRVIFWGVPAAIVVLCATSLEDKFGARVPSFLLLLGDASYSIYLTHTLVLPVLVVIVRSAMRYYPPIGTEYAFAALCYLIAVPVGVCSYKLIEQPIMAWFKQNRVRR